MKKLFFYVPMFGVGGVEASLETLLSCLPFNQESMSITIVIELPMREFPVQKFPGTVVKQIFSSEDAEKIHKAKNRLSWRDLPGLLFWLVARELKIWRMMERGDVLVDYFTFSPVSTVFWPVAKKVKWIHGPLTLFSRFLATTLWRRYDLLVAVSEPLRKSLDGLPVKAITVPSFSCRALRDVCEGDSAIVSTDSEGLICLSVGRLNEGQKDFERVIRAWHDVILTLPNDLSPTLVIAGEGPDKSYLEQLVVELELVASIVFVGEADIDICFQKADVFIFSSKYEGLGLVVMEAMAYGLPVVYSDCDYGPSWLLDGYVSAYPMSSFMGSRSIAHLVLRASQDSHTRLQRLESWKRRRKILQREQYAALMDVIAA